MSCSSHRQRTAIITPHVPRCVFPFLQSCLPVFEEVEIAAKQFVWRVAGFVSIGCHHTSWHGDPRYILRSPYGRVAACSSLALLCAPASAAPSRSLWLPRG